MSYNKPKSLFIVVDFDGTCTAHDFPRIGNDIGAVPVLKKLVAKGHKLILFTMRSDQLHLPCTSDDPTVHNVAGLYLTDAVNWFKYNDIPLYGVQTNPDQLTWTTSPKAYGHIHLDDAAMGCPLMQDAEVSPRPYVNWAKMEELLIENDIL